MFLGCLQSTRGEERAVNNYNARLYVMKYDSISKQVDFELSWENQKGSRSKNS